MAIFFFLFLIWFLRPYQEYFTYIKTIVHERWAKIGEPGEKPPETQAKLEPQQWET